MKYFLNGVYPVLSQAWGNWKHAAKTEEDNIGEQLLIIFVISDEKLKRFEFRDMIFIEQVKRNKSLFLTCEPTTRWSMI